MGKKWHWLHYLSNVLRNSMNLSLDLIWQCQSIYHPVPGWFYRLITSWFAVVFWEEVIEPFEIWHAKIIEWHLIQVAIICLFDRFGYYWILKANPSITAFALLIIKIMKLDYWIIIYGNVDIASRAEERLQLIGYMPSKLSLQIELLSIYKGISIIIIIILCCLAFDKL